MTVLFSTLAMTAALMLVAAGLDAILARRLRRTEPDPIWTYVTSVLFLVAALLNANLWLPMQPLAAGVVVLAVATLLVHRFSGGARVPVAAAMVPAAAVGLACVALWGLFRLSQWWLLEGPNHDSLFYFEGAAWAWQRGLRASPTEVALAWGLGVCTQGSVFVGTDCSVLRNGTYSMLSLATAFNRPASGNDVQAAASFAALLPALAAITLLPHISSKRLGFGVATATALIVFLSPGSIGALTNANVGTAFGAAAAAMTLGLAIAPCQEPRTRATVLGLGTAVAGHLYGEAAAVAGLIAASGVLADAVRLRQPSHVLQGGAIALGVCVLALNVVAIDLVRSFVAVSGVAAGGDWASWYIHASPWTWVGAPFAGILLGLEPAVSAASLALGIALAFTTVILGLLHPRTRVVTLAAIAVSLLLIGYVEVRAYAYGEHKVVQMLGPSASMLALAASLAWLQSNSGKPDFRVLTVAVLVILLAANLMLTGMRAFALLRDWAPLHGLDSNFSDGLRSIRPGEAVVLDDTGAVSVERFQKAHYLGFLLHANGARLLLPNLDDEPLRGGYLRLSRGGTFRGSPPQWVVQLTSEAGARSPFVYPTASVPIGREYRLMSLTQAQAVLAAGNGWYQCESNHCWTKESFEIEAFVAPVCSNPQLIVNLDFFHAPLEGRVQILSPLEQGAVPATLKILTVPLPLNWSRTTIGATWRLRSPSELGLSTDDRKLFARVEQVRVRCASPLD